MSATELMFVAIVLGVIGRWAHDQQAVPGPRGLVEIVFALLVIAALDQGRSQSVARGLAYLFLVAVLLSDNSPLTGLSKISSKGAATGAAAKKTANGQMGTVAV